MSYYKYPDYLRRVRFKDPETGKTLVFLTTSFQKLPAMTICSLYKARWHVELFFKWIKQHLRIKRFFGTSENAVKSQIWIAVSVYVLVCHRQEANGLRGFTLHFATNIPADSVRENAIRTGGYGYR